MAQTPRKAFRDFSFQIVADMSSKTKKRYKRRRQDENEPPCDPFSEGTLSDGTTSGIEDHSEGLESDIDVEFDSDDSSLITDSVVVEKALVTESYFCPCCSSGFTAEEEYKQHLASHNLKVDAVTLGSLEPHKCKICGEGFEVNAELTEHALNHIIKKPFSCRKCQKQFDEKLELEQHEKLHSGKVRKKPLKIKSQLKENSLNLVANKPFSCRTCKKQFTRRPWLDKHEKLHNSAQSRVRTVGHKPFLINSQQAENAANRKPSKPTRFECRSCCKLFLHPATLNQHTLNGRCMRDACV